MSSIYWWSCLIFEEVFDKTNSQYLVFIVYFNNYISSLICVIFLCFYITLISRNGVVKDLTGG